MLYLLRLKQCKSKTAPLPVMSLQHRGCVLLHDKVSLHHYPEGCGFRVAVCSPFLVVFLQ